MPVSDCNKPRDVLLRMHISGLAPLQFSEASVCRMKGTRKSEVRRSGATVHKHAFNSLKTLSHSEFHSTCAGAAFRVRSVKTSHCPGSPHQHRPLQNTAVTFHLFSMLMWNMRCRFRVPNHVNLVQYIADPLDHRIWTLPLSKKLTSICW